MKKRKKTTFFLFTYYNKHQAHELTHKNKRTELNFQKLDLKNLMKI